MASPNPLRLLVLLALLCGAFAISELELDAAISALRMRGYELFGNAITASDIRYDLLRPNSSYTLFAPPDAALFALDMAATAAAYVGALRRHIALGRLPVHILQSVPDGSALPTLLPHRHVRLSHSRTGDGVFLTVDGVEVVLPGLFLDSEVAVHGLAGILNLHRPGHANPPSRSTYSHYSTEIPPDSQRQSMHSGVHPPSSVLDSRLSPLRSVESPAPLLMAPDYRLSPSTLAESPASWLMAPDYRLPPSWMPESAPISHRPPSKSADPPELFTPVPSPTMPDTLAPTPRPTSPVMSSPSPEEKYIHPPLGPRAVADAPRAPTPAVDGDRETQIPTRSVSPGANPPKKFSMLSTQTSPAALEFSWNGGRPLGPRGGHRGSPRPLQHERADSL